MRRIGRLKILKGCLVTRLPPEVRRFPPEVHLPKLLRPIHLPCPLRMSLLCTLRSHPPISLRKGSVLLVKKISVTKRVVSGRKYQVRRVFAIHAQLSRKKMVALVMDVRLTVILAKMNRSVKRAMTYQKEALALIMVVYGQGKIRMEIADHASKSEEKRIATLVDAHIKTRKRRMNQEHVLRVILLRQKVSAKIIRRLVNGARREKNALESNLTSMITKT